MQELVQRFFCIFACYYSYLQCSVVFFLVCFVCLFILWSVNYLATYYNYTFSLALNISKNEG